MIEMYPRKQTNQTFTPQNKKGYYILLAHVNPVIFNKMFGYSVIAEKPAVNVFLGKQQTNEETLGLKLWLKVAKVQAIHRKAKSKQQKTRLIQNSYSGLSSALILHEQCVYVYILVSEWSQQSDVCDCETE